MATYHERDIQSKEFYERGSPHYNDDAPKPNLADQVKMASIIPPMVTLAVGVYALGHFLKWKDQLTEEKYDSRK